MKTAPIIAANLLLTTLALAQANPATQPATAPGIASATAPNVAPLTVAIFDFDANVPGSTDLGKQVGETLNALMSNQSGITLVDRSQIARTFGEQELNLTGLVDQDKVIKVGKLIGARIIITGKLFTLDKSIFATAKIIGTETSRVEGVLVKAKAGTDTGDLVAQLADKLQERLSQSARQLLPADDAKKDPLVALKQQFATKAKPVVMIQINERQIGQAPPAIDPPADTQLRTMLFACGFTVADPSETTPAKAKVDLLIKGEGFSEFAARVQNLYSCSGRVELSLVQVSDGHIIATSTGVARAADLSENLAGKTALQLAAEQAGVDLLQKLAPTLPDSK